MKDIELPPLPVGILSPIGELYTPEQMDAYAIAAVEADRAQRVPEDGFAVNFVVHAGLEKHKARECERIVRELLASTPAQPAQQEPNWWRKRADEIEVTVARSGSTEAMRCFTDMRTLLQAATTHQEPPQPVERKPMTDAEIEDLCGEANRGFCIELEDYKKAVRDTERHHGIME